MPKKTHVPVDPQTGKKLYTVEQLERQAYRQQVKANRKAAADLRDSLKKDEILIVAKGMPQAFHRGHIGSWVWPWDKSEQVLQQTTNKQLTAFKATVDWEQDTYYCHSDGRQHLFRLPRRLERV